MPLPIIVVPPFPNVPSAPGVPPVLRSAVGAVNSLTGGLTGVLDVRTGAFTGSVAGVLAQASGQVGTALGTLRGVLDASNNLSGILSGNVGGQVVGALTGVVDRVTGVIQAKISGVVDGLTGGFAALSGDSPTINAEAEPFQWGIYLSSGAPAITGDNVAAVEYTRDFRIATFPIESGGFESYNKVAQPYSVRLTFTQGGTVADRTAFLDAVEAAQASLDLYDVATPEKTYVGLNVVHVDMRRTSKNGATLLTVDVGLEQVRTAAAAAFSNTKAPSGADGVNAGAVQPAAPTPPQAVAIDSALAGAPAEQIL